MNQVLLKQHKRLIEQAQCVHKFWAGNMAEKTLRDSSPLNSNTRDIFKGKAIIKGYFANQNKPTKSYFQDNLNM